MSWNIEAHDPIEKEEAIPQLAYTAMSMMNQRETSISQKRALQSLFWSAPRFPRYSPTLR